MELKHKTTGEIIQYENGIMKSGNACIEGTPNMEFWEEVKVINHHILSVYCLKTKMQYNLNEIYPLGVLINIELLEDKTCKLYLENATGIYEPILDTYKLISVVRLSDTTVFNVGDRVKSEGGRTHHLIRSIHISQRTIGRNDIGYVYNGINEIYFKWDADAGGNWMENTHKYELQTTIVQGKEVTEDEKFYVINCKGSWNIVETFGGHYKKEDDKFKKFLTFEEAEEYRLLNKPCLSINDVAPMLEIIYSNNSIDNLNDIVGKLKTLVKNK